MLRWMAVPLVMILGTPALAQSYQGNWACRNAAGTAGLLTIQGGSYGFASPKFGDPGSGSGTIQGYADGVQFVDGQLRAALGVEAARLVTVDNGSALQLETATEILMLCTAI